MQQNQIKTIIQFPSVFWETGKYIAAENKRASFKAARGASPGSARLQVSLADFQGLEFESSCVQWRRL